MGWRLTKMKLGTEKGEEEEELRAGWMILLEARFNDFSKVAYLSLLIGDSQTSGESTLFSLITLVSHRNLLLGRGDSM